ncbi:metal ABC transporter permease [Kiritimatiellaeota bacterium B1221]|nr:metal ABC transporter permease [Kiritimatiellaeota bacterium B1221]
MNVDAWMDFEIWDVLFLKNYNTRLVVLSTFFLGISSGLAGSFLLLRKRSLMSDTLSHACLPGIGLMFIVVTLLGGNGKSLPLLLMGATVTGLLGVLLVTAIRNTSRIKDDAAMGIVLSVFFGLGIVMLSLAQTMGGAAAGLESFIYGKTASMVGKDLEYLMWITVVTVILCVALQKEFSLICFDENFARSLAWPVHFLDMLMMGLMVGVTVVGLQAVGLILIVAFMIIPAASARFWTEKYRLMWMLAGAIGGLSGWVGASVSAILPRMPAGAVIVLVSGVVFVFSMFFGASRGVCKIKSRQIHMRRKIGRQHFLRAVYEILDAQQTGGNFTVSIQDLLEKRSWSRKQLQKHISRAKREDHIETVAGNRIQLSEAGYAEAARYTRNHRLWELYLIRFADVATRHVDRDADHVEHVLGPEIVRQLEEELDTTLHGMTPPESPHCIVTEGSI